MKKRNTEPHYKTNNLPPKVKCVPERTPIALLSAFDNTGVFSFAQKLCQRGWQIWASDGTARHLTDSGLEITNISTIIGKPILGNSLVTLSREIHAGLLATHSPEDEAEMERCGIKYIDLLYVDLCPLKAEVGNKKCTINSVIEKTDTGGPAMLRSAAKGRRIVLHSPTQFNQAIDMITAGYPHKLPRNWNTEISGMAYEAEQRVVNYCQISADLHYQIWSSGGVRRQFLYH